MKAVSILVIDDEADNFDVIETLLTIELPKIPRQYQYSLHYASSGRQAIESLEHYQPDLILLDVMMPDIDGITVCRNIKGMPRWKTVPIIMVTALNSKSVLADCLMAGADDFISKPMVALELRSRMNSMLRIKQQFDSIQSLSDAQKNAVQYLESTLNVLQGNLASTLAHELNTPVQGIIGTFDLLMNYSTQMNAEEVQEILCSGHQSVYRLEHLIKKILLFLELELAVSKHDAFEFSSTKVTRNIFLESLHLLLKQFGREQDVIFDVEEGMVSIPSKYLSTILNELVDNSLKFSSPQTSIIIRHYIEDTWAKIVVTDFGRGMSKSQISMINAFVQFERSTYEQQGLGMGLKLVKKILELVGGQLTILSTQEEGTSAIVTLPLAIKV